MPGTKNASTTSLDSKTNATIRNLHNNLTKQWKFKSPDVRRILMTKDKTPASKKRQVFLSVDPFLGEDKLSHLKKSTENMRKMTRHEQMHKLQSALQSRIMVHKYGDERSVVYVSQIKVIRHLMEYLNRQMESLSKSVSLKAITPTDAFDSFVELSPDSLFELTNNFYNEKKSSRTIDDKILLSNKMGEHAVPSGELSLLRKSKRSVLVDKVFENESNRIVYDFPSVLRENETDFYFLLGFSSKPTVKQLLRCFRNIHHFSLKQEQQMYHLFRLSVLSNILIARDYSSKCLL